MMHSKVILTECFEKFEDTFSPKIIGELNGQYVMVVKLEGDKVPWHIHDNEDEMFWVVEGELDIFEKGKTTNLKTGEFYIVKKGVEHKVVPIGKVKLILFEPSGIKHTGDVQADITKDHFDYL